MRQQWQQSSDGALIFEARPASFIKRHKALSAMIGAFMAPFIIAAFAGLIMGIGRAASAPHAPAAPASIERAYADCLALAQRDGFAADACEGLSPSSPSELQNCSYERAHAQPMIDCAAPSKRP